MTVEFRPTGNRGQRKIFQATECNVASTVHTMYTLSSVTGLNQGKAGKLVHVTLNFTTDKKLQGVASSSLTRVLIWVQQIFFQIDYLTPCSFQDVYCNS